MNKGFFRTIIDKKKYMQINERKKKPVRITLLLIKSVKFIKSSKKILSYTLTIKNG